MSNDLIKALESVSKKKNIPVYEQKEEKPKKGKGDPELLYIEPKASIYLSDKDLPTVASKKAGDKVFIAIEATVRRLNTHEDISKDKKSNKIVNADLEIDSIADITEMRLK